MKHLIFPRQAGDFRALAWFVFVLAGCIFATSEVRAINRTWNGFDNGNWSDPDNWGPTGVPQNGDTLIFPVLTGFGREKSMVNDLANLSLELIIFTASGYSLTGNPLTLNQGVTDNHNTTGLNRIACALQFTSGGGRFNTLDTGQLEITGPVTLANHQDLIVTALITNLTVSGAIQGTGGLVKRGEGALYLRGTAANTYTGPTLIEGGAVHLAKTSAARAISAKVTINGSGTFTSSLADDLPGQYPPQLSMVITNGQWAITNGATVTNLVMNDAFIGGSGLLNLQCDVNVSEDSWIFCSLYLGDQTRTFFLNALAALEVEGQIIGPGPGANSPGIIKRGNGTLILEAANIYYGPTLVQQGQLQVRNGGALGNPGPGGETRVEPFGGLMFVGSAMTVPEPLVMESAFLEYLGTITLTGTLTLSDTCLLFSDDELALLEIRNVISGPGDLSVEGGTVRLSGATPNTFGGARSFAFVHNGILELAKPNNVTALPGRVDVRGSDNNIGVLRNLQDGGVSDISLYHGGSWLLNGHSVAPTALTFHGDGIVDTQGGQLQLANPGTNQLHAATGGIYTAQIFGQVACLGATNNITVDEGPTLNIHAQIAGGGVIRKLGSGTLGFYGNNTFNGELIINEGRLLAATGLAFGSSVSGTIVNSNASLALAGQVFLGAEHLTLNSDAQPALDAVAGFNGWGGIIQLSRDAHVKVSDPAGVLSFTGPVIGAGGLTKIGAGGLNLGGVGANSYAGLTVISSGMVEVNKPAHVLGVGGDAIIGDNANPPTNAILRAAIGHLRPTANVTVNRSGLFDIFNSPNPGLGIRTMPGAGRVNITSGSALTISNDVSFEFSGALTGAGALNKRGFATLHLSGDSPAYTGSATVFDGTSKVDGRIPNSPVTVKTDSNLRGGGVVGNVTAFETGSLISVDSVAPGTLGGDLEVGDLTMSAGGVSDGVVGLAFFGPSPTGGNDSIVARGAVNINSTRLSIGFGYPAREGDVMTLIKKNSAGPIIGTFTAWPEGIVRKLNDVTVRATYLGGDGNDFTLTVTNTAMGFASYRLAEGNGNQTVEPDECNLLFLSLANHRTNALRITNAVLRAVSGGLVLTPTVHPDPALVTIASAAYPTIPAGATRENLTPFQFRTTPNLPCGNPVTFELVVGVAGEGVFAITFTAVGGVDCARPTGGCESCLVVRGQFAADALASAPRLLFAGAPSICYPVKPCPGVVEADDLPPMHHVVHSFTNSATNEICVTAQLDFECPNAPTNALGVAAYLGEFRINQPCLNHLGDGGAGGPPYPPFSFRVPARTNFVIVVTARETNLVCDTYALELFGLPCPPPATAIARDSVTGNMRISWSSAYPDFRLQSVNALSGPVPFTDLATPPKLLSGQYTVTNVPDSGQKFHRLIRP